jgi:hypothetical protein
MSDAYSAATTNEERVCSYPYVLRVRPAVLQNGSSERRILARLPGVRSFRV